MDKNTLKFFKIINGKLAMISPDKAKGIALFVQTLTEFTKAYHYGNTEDKEGNLTYCCTKEMFHKICFNNNIEMYQYIEKDENEECSCFTCTAKNCINRKSHYLKTGKYYYLENGNSEESCLVYCYEYEGVKVIGFNCADGGTFLPVKDILPDSKFTEVKITRV